jgi:hypothetical protein
MTMDSRTAVLFDLDSTLRDSRHRHSMIPGDAFAGEGALEMTAAVDWHAYSVAGLKDAPFWGPITALRMFSDSHQIHIISGSNESAMEQTRSWLETHVGLSYIDVIHLRPTGDLTPNAPYKVSYAASVEAQGLSVVLFWEDWPPTVAELEDAGYPVVCVNPRYPCKACGSDPVAVAKF